MKILIFMIVPIFLLSGCAKMNIDVRILDRNFWSSPEHLSDSISEHVASMTRKRVNGNFVRTRESIKSQSLTAYEVLFQALLANRQADPNDKEVFRKKIIGFTDARFNEADKYFAEAFIKLGDASKSSEKNTRMSMLFDAQSKLDAGYATILLAQNQLNTDLRAQIDVAKSLLSSETLTSVVEASKQAASKNQDTVTGLIGDQGILEDPLASNVVYAPESYWLRSEPPNGFNETYASGNFGNTDIAIKMESIGNFTIKGVRLDSSKITQATFSVGRQAIKTVAAIYGIPMPVGTTAKSPPQTPVAQFAETTVGFDSPDRKRAAAEEDRIRLRLARLTLLETILIQQEALINTDITEKANSARATAIKTVKDVFTANRALLDDSASTSK